MKQGILIIALTILLVNFISAATINVYILQPSWDASGGGGVFSAYVGPPSYGYVSPGNTKIYDGREAGIIKAGLNIDADGHYWDEGLFGFKPTVTINQLAAGTLTYEVEKQEGTNPVWMTIEIDTGIAGDRSDNTAYQFVPTTNPIGWHTVDAAAGQWQKWNNNDGDVTGNPLIPLSGVATAHTGLNVVRAYLRLGMGDSYHGTGSGTVAWIDKITLGGLTYDFVVPTIVYVDDDDLTCGGNAPCFDNIQDAIDTVAEGGLVNVRAGTYNENQILVNKAVSVIGAGRDTTIIDGSGAALTLGGLVRITASGNVLFANFTLKNAGGPIVAGGDNGDNKYNFGIYAESSNSSAIYTINNTKIIGTNNPNDEEDYGLYSNSGKEKLIFTNSLITQTGANSILIETHPGPTEVSYNILDRGVGDGSVDSYFNMNYGGTDITSPQRVNNNTIDMGNDVGPFDNDHRGFGITFASSFTGTTTGGFTNVKITNNTIKNLKDFRRGIGFWNNAPGDGSIGNINAPIVSGNTITGAPGSVSSQGIRLLGLVTDAIITNNIISNVGISFKGQGWNNHIATGTKVNNNYFSSNTLGLVWEGTETLNATYNWWGSCDGPNGIGPGTGDSVTGNVLFAPWIGICITNKVGDSCALEIDNVSLSADLDGIEMSSCLISYTIGGVNKNKTGLILAGKCQATILSTELIGGQTIDWNVYANDSFGFKYSDGWKTFYVRNSTFLGVLPWVDASNGPDGLNGWWVTEPTFSLRKDSLEGGNSYYQWDSDKIFLYSGSFGLENIPNLPKESAGTLELNWWTDFGLVCKNETAQSKMFFIDLTDPVVQNSIPAENAIVTCNPKPEISAVMNEIYGSNSGVDKSSVLMEVDGSSVSISVTDISNLRVRASHTPPSALPEGAHLVEISGQDNAGNTFYKSWSFTINMNAIFNLSINLPKNQSYPSKQVPFNISTTNLVTEIEYINYNDRVPRWTILCRNCDEYGYSGRPKTKTLNEGINAIGIRATDLCGNVKEKNVSLFIDSKAPIISKTEPRRNGVTNGSDFSVKYTEDNLKQVLLSWNPTLNLTKCNESGKNIICNVQINSDLVAFDGQFIDYWFNVSDSVRSVQSKITTVLVDTTSPILTVNSPVDYPINTTIYGRKVPFNLSVSNLGVNEKVTLEFMDSSVAKPRWERICSNCDSYGVDREKIKSFARGTHDLIIKATDKAGNSDSEAFNFDVVF